MQMHDHHTFYIVKLCRPHSLMIGWSAMDIGENVNDLDEWMATVRTDNTYFRFMRHVPKPCAICLNPLSKTVVEYTLTPREKGRLERQEMQKIRSQNLVLEKENNHDNN